MVETVRLAARSKAPSSETVLNSRLFFQARRMFNSNAEMTERSLSITPNTHQISASVAYSVPRLNMPIWAALQLHRTMLGPPSALLSHHGSPYDTTPILQIGTKDY